MKSRQKTITTTSKETYLSRQAKRHLQPKLKSKLYFQRRLKALKNLSANRWLRLLFWGAVHWKRHAILRRKQKPYRKHTRRLRRRNPLTVRHYARRTNRYQVSSTRTAAALRYSHPLRYLRHFLANATLFKKHNLSVTTTERYQAKRIRRIRARNQRVWRRCMATAVKKQVGRVSPKQPAKTARRLPARKVARRARRVLPSSIARKPVARRIYLSSSSLHVLTPLLRYNSKVWQIIRKPVRRNRRKGWWRSWVTKNGKGLRAWRRAKAKKAAVLFVAKPLSVKQDPWHKRRKLGHISKLWRRKSKERTYKTIKGCRQLVLRATSSTTHKARQPSQREVLAAFQVQRARLHLSTQASHKAKVITKFRLLTTGQQAKRSRPFSLVSKRKQPSLLGVGLAYRSQDKAKLGSSAYALSLPTVTATREVVVQSQVRAHILCDVVRAEQPTADLAKLVQHEKRRYDLANKVKLNPLVVSEESKLTLALSESVGSGMPAVISESVLVAVSVPAKAVSKLPQVPDGYRSIFMSKLKRFVTKLAAIKGRLSVLVPECVVTKKPRTVLPLKGSAATRSLVARTSKIGLRLGLFKQLQAATTQVIAIPKINANLPRARILRGALPYKVSARAPLRAAYVVSPAPPVNFLTKRVRRSVAREQKRLRNLSKRQKNLQRARRRYGLKRFAPLPPAKARLPKTKRPPHRITKNADWLYPLYPIVSAKLTSQRWLKRARLYASARTGVNKKSKSKLFVVNRGVMAFPRPISYRLRYIRARKRTSRRRRLTRRKELCKPTATELKFCRSRRHSTKRMVKRAEIWTFVEPKLVEELPRAIHAIEATTYLRRKYRTVIKSVTRRRLRSRLQRQNAVSHFTSQSKQSTRSTTSKLKRIVVIGYKRATTTNSKQNFISKVMKTQPVKPPTNVIQHQKRVMLSVPPVAAYTGYSNNKTLLPLTSLYMRQPGPQLSLDSVNTKLLPRFRKRVTTLKLTMRQSKRARRIRRVVRLRCRHHIRTKYKPRGLREEQARVKAIMYGQRKFALLFRLTRRLHYGSKTNSYIDTARRLGNARRGAIAAAKFDTKVGAKAAGRRFFLLTRRHITRPGVIYKFSRKKRKTIHNYVVRPTPIERVYTTFLCRVLGVRSLRPRRLKKSVLRKRFIGARHWYRNKPTFYTRCSTGIFVKKSIKIRRKRARPKRMSWRRLRHFRQKKRKLVRRTGQKILKQRRRLKRALQRLKTTRMPAAWLSVTIKRVVTVRANRKAWLPLLIKFLLITQKRVAAYATRRAISVETRYNLWYAPRYTPKAPKKKKVQTRKRTRAALHKLKKLSKLAATAIPRFKTLRHTRMRGYWVKRKDEYGKVQYARVWTPHRTISQRGQRALRKYARRSIPRKRAERRRERQKKKK